MQMTYYAAYPTIPIGLPMKRKAHTASSASLLLLLFWQHISVGNFYHSYFWRSTPYPTSIPRWVPSWFPFTVNYGSSWYIHNPHQMEPDFTLINSLDVGYRLNCLDEHGLIIITNKRPNSCKLNLTFILDWRVVYSENLCCFTALCAKRILS